MSITGQANFFINPGSELFGLSSARLHNQQDWQIIAEALREVSNSPRTPHERIEYDRELAELRAGMG